MEDDPNIRDIVKAYLIKEGYQVTMMETAEDAWENAKKQQPNMWILDIMLPGMDGYELCKKIRARSEVPIIIISAKDEEVDKILGLELGSDDYLTKPFSPRELVARVKRLFKRLENSPMVQKKTNTVEIDDLKMDQAARQVFWRDQEIDVTTKEFDMLEIFAKRPNRAFAREELLSLVWGGEDYFGSDRAVDDLVKRLRKKLEGLPVETVWGLWLSIAY